MYWICGKFRLSNKGGFTGPMIISSILARGGFPSEPATFILNASLIACIRFPSRRGLKEAPTVPELIDQARRSAELASKARQRDASKGAQQIRRNETDRGEAAYPPRGVTP